MDLIRILVEDDCTSLLYVKGGANYKNAVLLVSTQGRMAIFGHIMATYCKVWV